MYYNWQRVYQADAEAKMVKSFQVIDNGWWIDVCNQRQIMEWAAPSVNTSSKTR